MMASILKQDSDSRLMCNVVEVRQQAVISLLSTLDIMMWDVEKS